MDEKKANHWCRICGKKYYACDSCYEVKYLHPYKTICCSPEHFQLFTLLKMLERGLIEKNDAISALKELNIAEKEQKRFIPAVKEQLSTLYQSHHMAKPKKQQANINEKEETTTDGK